jgi:hypothetical protein
VGSWKTEGLRLCMHLGKHHAGRLPLFISCLPKENEGRARAPITLCSPVPSLKITLPALCCLYKAPSARIDDIQSQWPVKQVGGVAT